jgi:uncharacterized membrane protein YsdA (DUF1294 family)
MVGAIAEATLHSMSFFGGWPGALLAQQFLRHKSNKAAFQWAYKFTVVLNISHTRVPEQLCLFILTILRARP